MADLDESIELEKEVCTLPEEEVPEANENEVSDLISPKEEISGEQSTGEVLEPIEKESEEQIEPDE